MLRAVAPGPAVVVCSTCRFSADRRGDESGQSGGALLARAMREVQASEPALAGVAVQEMACLFACKRHCTVHVRAPGRMGYVLGDFAPEEAAARAILEYAARHAASPEGVVPYAEWPEGVKGHFITRTPPEGYVCE
jgi:predicted metal-binding protein